MNSWSFCCERAFSIIVLRKFSGGHHTQCTFSMRDYFRYFSSARKFICIWQIILLYHVLFWKNLWFFEKKWHSSDESIMIFEINIFDYVWCANFRQKKWLENWWLSLKRHDMSIIKYNIDRKERNLPFYSTHSRLFTLSDVKSTLRRMFNKIFVRFIRFSFFIWSNWRLFLVSSMVRRTSNPNVWISVRLE